MIYYFLLFLSILLAVLKSSVYNAYAKNGKTTLGSTFSFNAACYAAASAISLGVLIFDFSLPSLPTLICAAFYALIVFGLQTVSVIAMKIGSMRTTAIFVMYGMIIPSLAGPMFWHEDFGILSGVGIVLMLASLWLLKDKPTSTDGSASKSGLILSIVAFLLSGMAGVMEKIHQSTDGKEEKASFVFVACVIMLLFSVIGIFTFGKDGGKTKRQIPPAGVISGLIVGFYSIINLTLAGKLDSMVYYPIANGGAMLLTVLVSALVFGERFDRTKAVGTAIGLCGIILLSIA